jgi:hypothetical protein
VATLTLVVATLTSALEIRTSAAKQKSMTAFLPWQANSTKTGHPSFKILTSAVATLTLAVATLTLAVATLTSAVATLTLVVATLTSALEIRTSAAKQKSMTGFLPWQTNSTKTGHPSFEILTSVSDRRTHVDPKVFVTVRWYGVTSGLPASNV